MKEPPPTSGPARRETGQCPSPAALFAELWAALAEVLGTAAAAALLRRAAKQAAEAHPSLGELVIEREEYGYRYTLPRAWEEGSDAEDPLPALRALGQRLSSLLEQLTGPIVVRRLSRAENLERWVFAPPVREQEQEQEQNP